MPRILMCCWEINNIYTFNYLQVFGQPSVTWATSHKKGSLNFPNFLYYHNLFTVVTISFIEKVKYQQHQTWTVLPLLKSTFWMLLVWHICTLIPIGNNLLGFLLLAFLVLLYIWIVLLLFLARTAHFCYLPTLKSIYLRHYLNVTCQAFITTSLIYPILHAHSSYIGWLYIFSLLLQQRFFCALRSIARWWN